MFLFISANPHVPGLFVAGNNFRLLVHVLTVFAFTSNDGHLQGWVTWITMLKQVPRIPKTLLDGLLDSCKILQQCRTRKRLIL